MLVPPTIRSARIRRQRGGAIVEFLLVALFVVVVLIADPDVMEKLAKAIHEAYQSFLYALSASWY